MNFEHLFLKLHSEWGVCMMINGIKRDEKRHAFDVIFRFHAGDGSSEASEGNLLHEFSWVPSRARGL